MYDDIDDAPITGDYPEDDAPYSIEGWAELSAELDSMLSEG